MTVQSQVNTHLLVIDVDMGMIEGEPRTIFVSGVQ
jgi:hypothetical protein